MFSFDLTNLSRKAVWIAIAMILSIVLIFQSIAIIVKRPSLSTGSTACGRTVSKASNEYSDYLGSASAQASIDRNFVSTADDEDGLEIVELESDILLYPAVIIAADGHKVKITGQTTYQAGSSAMTKVWVDENDNNQEDEGECIEELSSFMSSVYLYGGSDSLATNCNSISITMEGGEIGAIFAGGYYQNVTTQSVDIKILGGSVHYVDCGSHVGPLGESLTASGSISVLLQDCRYRSNFPINGLNSESFHGPNITVRDFSDHRNAQSYIRHKPVFTNYIAQFANGCYTFGGEVSVPADRTIQANVLVVADSSEVNNLGKVAISTCADIYMLKDAVWKGNAIETTHTEGDVLSYDYSSHVRKCTICNLDICNEHVWIYPYYSTDTHAKQCGICKYNYAESCDMVDEFNNSYLGDCSC